VALPSTTLDNGGNGNELPPPLDVSCNNCPTNQPCMPDCDTQIAPTDEYVLRLMTVTYSPKGHVGDAAALKNIRVQICAPQCVDVTDGETGVPMTGSQLARGFRIQISERDETMFVDWKGASYNSPAQRRSICKGYSFRFDRNSTLKYRTEPTFPNPFRRGKLRFISFYLDPPGTRRARCPHKAKWLP